MSTLRNQMIQLMQLKGYSPKTIDAYLESLSALSKHYNSAPDLLTIVQIRDYIHHQITVKKLSKSWMNQLVSALKILYCQVLKRDWDPIDIPRPRREIKLPVVFSKDEVKAIINVTRNLKHRTLLMLTYSAGLRLSEVKNLKIGDIDSQRMQIKILQAKGYKDRWVVLSPLVLVMLRQYWKMYHPSTWLFETKPGKSLADKTVQSIFKNALRKSGVKKDAGIHSLRHSFATHLMEQGVALPVIQQMLGHKSIRTTSVYLHVQQYSIDTIKSPLDSLSL